MGRAQGVLDAVDELDERGVRTGEATRDLQVGKGVATVVAPMTPAAGPDNAVAMGLSATCSDDNTPPDDCITRNGLPRRFSGSSSSMRPR